MILWYFGVQDTLNGIYLTRLSYITQIYAMFAETPLYYFDFSFFYIFISSIYFGDGCESCRIENKKIALMLFVNIKATTVYVKFIPS